MKLKNLDYLFCDWSYNDDIRIKILLLLHRIGFLLGRVRCLWVFHKIFSVLYTLYSKCLLSLELPLGLKMGLRVRIFHGYGLVVNEAVVIGDDVILRHGVTIGNITKRNGEVRSLGDGRACPIIGNNVDIGCGATIIGPIIISDDVRIGANAVVRASLTKGTTYV